MGSLVTCVHYISTFFLFIGIIVFVRFLFLPVRLTPVQRETKVYIPAYGFFFVSALSEAVSCYFSDRVDDFHTTVALAVVPFVLFACLCIKNVRRKLAKREEDGNP